MAKRGQGLTPGASISRPGSGGRRFEDLGIDVAFYSQRTRPTTEVLPWDHVRVKYGRDYLVKEQDRSVVQLDAMASAL